MRAKVAAISALTLGVTGLVTFGLSGCATQGQKPMQQNQPSSQTQTSSPGQSQGQSQTPTSQGDSNSTQPTPNSPLKVSTSNPGAPPVQQYYIDSKTFLIRPDPSSSTTGGGANGPGSSDSSGAANPSKEKVVLLTFDDGPNGTSTMQILQTLDKYHAKAIWFISGYHYGPQYRPDANKAPQFDTLVKAIQSSGNIIGNHTWMHDNLSKLPAQTQRNEITELNAVLKGITGKTPQYLRPPYGVSTTVLDNEMKTLNMQWLNWSVGSMDWVYTEPNKVVHQVLSTVYNGGVILMHDNDVEAKALDPMLKALTAEGYHFVLPTEVRPN